MYRRASAAESFPPGGSTCAAPGAVEGIAAGSVAANPVGDGLGARSPTPAGPAGACDAHATSDAEAHIHHRPDRMPPFD
jgi:hypothetical protein